MAATGTSSSSARRSAARPWKARWAKRSAVPSTRTGPPPAARSIQGAPGACSTGKSAASLPERGHAAGLLFEAHLGDRQPRPLRLLEEDAREVFGGRRHVERAKRLAERAQGRHQWIVAVEQKLVVELLVHVGAHPPLDEVEVGHHPLLVQRLRPERHERARIVAVQPPALAGMAEQSVPVAEGQLLGDLEHAPIVTRL